MSRDYAALSLAELDQLSIRTGCETEINALAEFELRQRGYRYNASESRWELAAVAPVAPAPEPESTRELLLMTINLGHRLHGESPTESLLRWQHDSVELSRLRAEAVAPVAPRRDAELIAEAGSWIAVEVLMNAAGGWTCEQCGASSRQQLYRDELVHEKECVVLIMRRLIAALTGET